MYSKELLKGTLKTIILSQLKEHGRMYGYEITQRVKTLSGGSIQLTEGALYPALHKLEKEGFLKTEKVHIGRRVRKYYTLTTKGKKASVDKIKELQAFFAALQKVMHLSLD